VNSLYCAETTHTPADATAMPLFLDALKPRRFTFLLPAYQGCPGKEAIKQVLLLHKQRGLFASALSRMTISL